MIKQHKKNSLMLVTGGLGSGGLERIVANVANYYAKKGWNVSILLLLDPTVFQILEPSIKVYSMFDKTTNSRKWSRVFSWIKFIKQHAKQEQPDIVVAMTFKIGSMVRIACKNKNTRIIVREINDPQTRNKMANAITDYFVKKCDGIIFQTEWERMCHSKKCQKIGHIIVNPVIIPMEAVVPKRKVIATMGRLDLKQKRQDVLIRSFALLHKKYPDYILEIYGDGSEENKEYLMNIVREENLEGFVKFIKARQDVHKCIRDAEMFVLTSDYEGLSNALLEAWLMGIPCITSDWNGVEDVVTNHENGLIVKRGDAIAFAQAMEFYIENPDLAQKYAENAKTYAYKYDINFVIKQWEKLLEDFKEDVTDEDE